ncbi:hypothetical protein QEZ54_29525 [Catellatospora sp. KI3]|uniref:hypothetical protein n=1 Tax=Catellatospora sp. KI3 TaxID=3041620 RepID=UPI002482DE7D|nr:hypothetical protein [Catellatospora sp. KI3]MDI1465118.1 hypothetical protein [Catellatospora sp. KI3]
MRLIVGPLPAAVYWRRRAIVLGAVLLAVLMISLVARGTGSDGARTNTAATASPEPSLAEPPSPEPSPSPSDDTIVPASDLSPSPSPSPVTDPEQCGDHEIKVTAKAAQTSLKRGTELYITLLIKNVGRRTCLRDVGADLQELRLLDGTTKVWSSDDCGGPRGHEVRQFPPNHERAYTVIWNGHASTACAKTMKRTPDGPIPDAGDYQLFGRVGTAISHAVTIKLT